MSQDHDRPLIVAVVDDDPAVRDSLATVFQMEGFHVWTYGTGANLLAVAKTVTPDCLLLDVHTPVRSGLDILEVVGGADLRRSDHHDLRARRHSDGGSGDQSRGARLHREAVRRGRGDRACARHRDGLSAPARIQRTRAGERSTLRSRRYPDGQGSRSVDQITKGLSDKEAGRILGISPRTVEVHRARIMERSAPATRPISCGSF